jgi:hypothetical protein
LQSYFVDFDDEFDDPDARGRMGDVAIFRDCARARLGEAPPAGPPAGPPAEPGPTAEPIYSTGPPPIGPIVGPDGPGPWPDWPWWPWWPDGPPSPPPLCPPGTHLANGLQCCEGLQVPGPNGQCRSPCADGSTAALDMIACRAGFQPLGGGVPAGGTCWNGTAPVPVPGPACVGGTGYNCWKCPKPPHATCEGGAQIQNAPAPLTTASDWSNADCPPPCLLPGTTHGNDGLCHPAAVVCPGGTPASNARPVRMCCLNGTNPDPITGRCQPGLYVPQPWYLNYLATGSNPCPFPYTWCSFYEFTIRGEERFGRGTLRQRITLPAGSDFPSVRITKGARHCPASAWSCRKEGDAVTCSTDNCGLGAGDEVVLRIGGKVAPNQTAPLSAAVEKTACGVLESEPMPGRGPATIVQPDEFRRAQATYLRQDAPAGTSDTVRPGSTSRQACWSIVLLPETPATTPTPPTFLVSCAAGYVATADGQCCLSRQMTRSGICCPAGQRPNPDGRTCSPRCPEGHVWTGNACACPPGTVDIRGRCVSPPTPPPPIICTGGKVLVGRHCECPPGTVERRGQCIGRTPPPPLPPCTGGRIRVDERCVCPEGTFERRGQCVPRREPPPPCAGGRVMIDGACRCPEGTFERRGQCVRPDIAPPPRPCAGGRIRVDGRCVCPEGTYDRRGRCAPRREPPPTITCPEGTYRRGGRCVPRRGPPPPITCPAGTVNMRGRCVPTRPPRPPHVEPERPRPRPPSPQIQQMRPELLPVRPGPR